MKSQDVRATPVRILVVEDEPALLGLLLRFLKRLSYEADGVASSSEAVAAVERDPAGYQLVLTDLTLADIGGEDLIEKLRAIQPNLRGIVSSGYPYMPRAKDIGFLQKPYLPSMLSEELRKALNGFV